VTATTSDSITVKFDGSTATIHVGPTTTFASVA
jgi:hypothetical protein